MKIRPATADDAASISRLIRGVAHCFMLDPQGRGAEEFLKSIEPEAIQRCVLAANFSYCIGEVGSQVAGVVAMRDNSHLYHLFVAREFQGKGLSRLLWQRARTIALAAGNPGSFTVNSTPCAVAVYERFGFKATGPSVETKGIAYVPMRFDPEARSMP